VEVGEVSAYPSRQCRLSRHDRADLLHPIRGTFRRAARQHRDVIAKVVRPIYTAGNANAAAEAFNKELRSAIPGSKFGRDAANPPSNSSVAMK